jgi:hypothetical protein
LPKNVFGQNIIVKTFSDEGSSEKTFSVDETFTVRDQHGDDGQKLAPEMFLDRWAR